MTNPDQGRRTRVGIDVSKKALDVCILPEGTPQGESFTLANNQEGIDEPLWRLQGANPALVVLEATGRYERLAATSIAATGIPVAVVGPPPPRVLGWRGLPDVHRPRRRGWRGSGEDRGDTVSPLRGRGCRRPIASLR